MNAEDSRRPSFALTYFPSGSDPRAATPLKLRPGEQIEADFTLRPAHGTNVRLLCPIYACFGSVNLYAVGINGVETLVRTTGPGEAVIPAVLPGRYVVRYTGPDGTMRKTIEVGGGEVTVEMLPKPAATVTGKLALQNPKDQPRNPVYVNLVDEDTGEASTVSVGLDGTFSWPMVAASRARMLLTGADGLFIRRISVQGATAKEGIISIPDTGNVNITLIATDATGELKGLVMDGDKPVPAVMVVLAPVPASNDPYSYHGFQTDSDGSFDFTGVPSGTYVAFAVDSHELEYTNSEVVRPYLALGKRVRIDAHASVSQRIDLTATK
jgi:hypothetical protein